MEKLLFLLKTNLSEFRKILSAMKSQYVFLKEKFNEMIIEIFYLIRNFEVHHKKKLFYFDERNKKKHFDDELEEKLSELE